MWYLKQLFWWAIAGALLAMLVGGSYYAYNIVQAGKSLSSVPPQTLLLDYMRLHVLAGWGAAGGIALGLLVRIPWLLRILWRSLRGESAPVAQDGSDPDSLIRADRSQRADEWLAQREDRDLDYVWFGNEGDEDAPDVENVITARNGTFTYRVLAYRHLSHDERMRVVHDALRRGHIKEPEPGGTATLVTSLGRRAR